MPEIKSQFATLGEKEINRIKRFPCIFAYEQVHHKDAYIGYITGISERQANVKIDYTLTGEKVLFQDFVSLSRQLDLGS